MSQEDERFFMLDVTEGWRESKKKDEEEFNKAYALAKEVHKYQFRDEGTPYISHIDGIIDIMKNELEDKNYRAWMVIALHDVLEDSNEITYKDLENLFGKYTAEEVQLLTKSKDISIETYLKNMEEY